VRLEAHELTEEMIYATLQATEEKISHLDCWRGQRLDHPVQVQSLVSARARLSCRSSDIRIVFLEVEK